MIREERLLKILHIPHVSEKTSTIMKKDNTLTFKVTKNATKIEIKTAIHKLFEVEVNNVRTIIIKGKVKRNKQRFSRRNNWKKAYITLKKGQNLDFVSNAK